MMPADEVKEVVRLTQYANCTVWIDGGWGIDALLRQQTRQHQDLDIAVKLAEVDVIRRLLFQRGYEIHEDEMPTRLEFRDSHDHRIDLHPLIFDAEGNGLQELQDGSFGKYTAQGLTGEGEIGGMSVKCLSPELQLKFHTGYTPDDDDRHDVELLVRTFRLSKPSGF